MSRYDEELDWAVDHRNLKETKVKTLIDKDITFEELCIMIASERYDGEEAIRFYREKVKGK